MTEIGHDHQHIGGRDHDNAHHGHRPYWKRAHHDWRFWVGVFFMSAAIIIYVMSGDLAWRPRSQRQQPQSEVGGR